MAEESLKVIETSSRKRSGGKSWFIGDGIEVSPRYLRAPTANCHHFCKYGVKPEVKEEQGKVLSAKKKFEKLHKSRTSLPGVHELHKSKARVSNAHEVPKSSTSHLSDAHEVSKSSTSHLSDAHQVSKSSTSHLSDAHQVSKSSTNHLSDGHETSESRARLSDGSELPKSENVVLSEKKKWEKLKPSPTSKTSLSGVHEVHKSKSQLADVHEASKSRISRLSDAHETPKSRISRLSDAHGTPKSRTCLSEGRQLPKSGISSTDNRNVSKLKGCASDTQKATKQEVLSSRKAQPSVKTTLSKGKSPNLATKSQSPIVKLLPSTSKDKSSNMSRENATLKPKSPAVKLLHPTPSARTAPPKAKSSNMATKSATLKTNSPAVKPLHPTSSVRPASPKVRSSNTSTNSATLKPKSPAVKPLRSTEHVMGGLSSRKNSGVNLGKASGGYKVAGKKILTPSVSSPRPVLGRAASSKLRKQRSLKIASPSKSQNTIRKSEVKQPDQDEVQKKTQCVITSETESKASQSCGFGQNGNFAVPLSVSPSMTSPKSSSEGEVLLSEFDQGGSSAEGQNKIRKSKVQQPGQDEVQGKTLSVIASEIESRPSEPCGFDQNANFGVGLSASSSMTSPKSSSHGEFEPNDFDQGRSSVEGQKKIRKSEVKQSDQGEVQGKTLSVIASETENRPSESCGFDQNGNFGVGLSASPSMTSPKSSSQGEFEPNEFDQGGSSVEGQNKIRKSEVKQPDEDEVQEKTQCGITSEVESKPSESVGFDQNGNFAVGLSASPSMASPKSSPGGECQFNKFVRSESNVESQNKIKKSEVKQPDQDEILCVITSEIESRPSESCGFDQNGNFAAGLSVSPSMTSPKSSSEGECSVDEFDRSEGSVECQNKIRNSEVKQPDQDEVQEKNLCAMASDTENRPSESCGFDQNGNIGVGVSASPSMTSPKSSSQGESEPNESDQSEWSAELSQHPPCDCDQREKIASPLKSSTEQDFALASHDDDEEDYDDEEEDYDNDEADDIDEEEIEDYLEKSMDTETAMTSSEFKRMVRKAAKVHAEDDDDDVEDEYQEEKEEYLLEKSMDTETAMTSSEFRRMVRKAAKVHAEDDSGDEDEDEEEEKEDCVEKSMDTETAMTSSELKKMVRRAAKVHADDVMVPTKLTFRRGKVIEIQTEDNNGPRRLKFRRGRVLDEEQILKAIARSRSFRARKIAERKGSETGPENVVLRHQEMQEKKDEKGLFNNVIEETASKLEEAKKSKVKALVGAFETVISLQDLKPSATTVS